MMKKLILSIALIMAAFWVSAQDCGNLFFSEYVEGSGNSKAMEIYNPTDNPVDLALYSIKRYSNGSPFPTEELILSGTLQPKGVVVVTNGQTDSVWVSSGGGYWSPPVSEALYALGDLHCSGLYPTPFYFNGNDAITLETITGGVIDIFGKIGDDPGDNGWNDIPPTYTAGTQYWTSWSVDNTLIRKASVKKGVTEHPALFRVHPEWDSIPKDTYDSLRFHKCDCGVTGIGDISMRHSLVAYPNPVTGNNLEINASSPWNRVEFYNLLGQKSFEQQYDQALLQRSVTIPEMKEGVYMMKVYFKDGSALLQKIVVR
jgi:hypothetical protein